MCCAPLWIWEGRGHKRCSPFNTMAVLKGMAAPHGWMVLDVAWALQPERRALSESRSARSSLFLMKSSMMLRTAKLCRSLNARLVITHSYKRLYGFLLFWTSPLRLFLVDVLIKEKEYQQIFNSLFAGIFNQDFFYGWKQGALYLRSSLSSCRKINLD